MLGQVSPGFPARGAPYSPNVGSYLGDECPNDHSKSKLPTITDPELITMGYDLKVPSLVPPLTPAKKKKHATHRFAAAGAWCAPGSTARFLTRLAGPKAEPSLAFHPWRVIMFIETINTCLYVL